MGMDSFDATVQQKTPSGDGVDVTSLVVNDLEKRSQAGERKYGTKLRTFNGRNALVDLYQELLDAVCYARQLIEEERGQ